VTQANELHPTFVVVKQGIAYSHESLRDSSNETLDGKGNEKISTIMDNKEEGSKKNQ
jgi:hypothetical protein